MKPEWSSEGVEKLTFWLVPHFLKYFPKWDWWDLASELFILVHDRYDRWDPEIASLPRYCLTHFRDPLTIRYHADTGLRIYRRSNKPRKYFPNVEWDEDYAEPHLDPEPAEEVPRHKLTLKEAGLVQKRMRGYTLKQIGLSENVSEARMCQILRTIRTKLNGTYFPDPDC